MQLRYSAELYYDQLCPKTWLDLCELYSYYLKLYLPITKSREDKIENSPLNIHPLSLKNLQPHLTLSIQNTFNGFLFVVIIVQEIEWQESDDDYYVK